MTFDWTSVEFTENELTMKISTVVLSIDHRNERNRMRDLLEHAGWKVLCVSHNSLLEVQPALLALVITNTTHDGTQVIDTIVRLLDVHNDLAVMFVLPKSPRTPSWGQQFLGKKVGFFTFGYADQEFISFVRAFADIMNQDTSDTTE
jgi:hypothetical protein